MKNILIIFLAFLYQSVSAIFPANQALGQKPRILITTDIGGDPDDQQAMIRFMLYTNEFDVEGLISSGTHTPEHPDEDAIRPELIEEIIHAYGQVYPKLLKHDAHYPTEDYLMSVLKTGNIHRRTSPGKGRDSEGSDWIIRAVDRKDKRPLNICIFGGQVELAQALWKVKHTRSEKEYLRFISKIRVFDVSDQDQLFDEIISENPTLFYILAQAPKGHDKREGSYRGMYLGGDESLTSLQWLKENVIEEHGPLGKLYPQKTWTSPNLNKAMKEGDSPSWFFFIPNGLNSPEHPEYGGWGGRYNRTPAGYYRDAMDDFNGEKLARATVYRWRDDYQRDFAARMDWCVKDYDEANHAPVASVNGDSKKKALILYKKAGTVVNLDASASADPDGDRLSFQWMVYPEAGNFTGNARLESNGPEATVHMPELATGSAIHIILRVTDNRDPKMTVYKRIILLNR